MFLRAGGEVGAAFIVPLAGTGPLPDPEVGLGGAAPLAPFAPGGGGVPLPAPVGGPI